MQQQSSKYFTHRTPPPTPPTLVMGSIGQISNFAEHDHVAYQIKGNQAIKQHGSKFLPSDPLSHDPSGLVKR